MTSPENSQHVLLAYILGDLSLEERERIDSALLLDQDFSDSFAQARYDLIDAYAANELAPHIRRRVELALLQSGDSRDELLLAASLRAVEKVQWPPSPPRPRPVPAKRPRIVWVALLSPAIAACCVAAVLFVRSHRTGNSLTETASTRTVASASAQAPPLGTPLLSGPGPGTSKPQASGAGGVIPAATAKPNTLRSASVMVFAMPVGTLRGPGVIAIQMSPGIHSLDVQWAVPKDIPCEIPPSENVPSQENFQACMLQISSGRNTIALLPPAHLSTLAGPVRVAHFFVPANLLPAGEFSLKIQTASQQKAPLAQASIRISR